LTNIICTVTNDLSYDQRMQRICKSLANAGYDVLLVGRKQRHSIPLLNQNFKQRRLYCFFNKGYLFYAEYNMRLFLFLLFQKASIFCAIDLDTILPVFFISVIKNKKRVYDAHELFTEQIEIVSRPVIYHFWKAVERFTVAKFKYGYTVNGFIQQELKKQYRVNYAVIRNLPLCFFSVNLPPYHQSNRLIIYQGSVNEGRCFETLIPAMKQVNAHLIICGRGNFFEQVKVLIRDNNVTEKVELTGYLTPDKLRLLTPTARLGLTLFESTGLNQYHSLSNRFFDYIMAGIPQICMAYPEYKIINAVYEVALLIDDSEEDTIARALNNLLSNTVVYSVLQQNCLKARTVLNWEKEEKELVAYYKNVIE
jgi:glycosyltransferase involved in cell wall biosynthesis